MGMGNSFVEAKNMSSCPFALNNFPEENRPVMSVNNANKAKTCECEILSWKVPSEGFVFSFCYNFLSKKKGLIFLKWSHLGRTFLDFVENLFHPVPHVNHVKRVNDSLGRWPVRSQAIIILADAAQDGVHDVHCVCGEVLAMRSFRSVGYHQVFLGIHEWLHGWWDRVIIESVKRFGFTDVNWKSLWYYNQCACADVTLKSGTWEEAVFRSFPCSLRQQYIVYK